MDTELLQLLLADDDDDDCFFFEEALNELPVAAVLTTVTDGEQLMQLLTQNTTQLPDILFLDLNMPRKNGYECLLEMKMDERLKQLPVIILSTSFGQEVADQLYKNGANYCMRKPAAHSELKRLIQQALTLVAQKTDAQPVDGSFIVSGS